MPNLPNEGECRTSQGDRQGWDRSGLTPVLLDAQARCMQLLEDGFMPFLQTGSDRWDVERRIVEYSRSLSRWRSGEGYGDQHG
jgi:hypothetical protein